MSDEIAVRNSAGHTVSDRLARREHEFLEFVEYVLDVAEWAVFQRFMEGRRPFEIAEDMNRSVAQTGRIPKLSRGQNLNGTGRGRAVGWLREHCYWALFSENASDGITLAATTAFTSALILS